ncbi:MAG TPA: dynamin family protein [Actinomycetota bacterium]
MGEATFSEERDALFRTLSALAELADERERRNVLERAQALRDDLARNRFNVVLLGEFKRGKTTFVNALLGAPLLPAAVVPLTSVITLVRWGPQVHARIVFRDGRELEVGADDLPTYVTERENPGNRRGVDHAILTHTSELLADGVSLVDTPGVGSIYQHNSETARRFLPEVDAAVFLTSADPPISASEREFLHEVRAEAARTFFVLNKVDHLSETDRCDALIFTEEALRDALGRDVTVYAVSARDALEAKLAGDTVGLDASGLATFERDFRRFLLEDKGRTILASIGGRTLRLAEGERNAIDVELRTARLSWAQLAEVRERIEGVFQHARTARRDVRALLRNELELLTADLEQDLRFLRAREETHLSAVAEEHLRDPASIRRGSEALNELLRETLRTDLEGWRTEEEEKLQLGFRTVMARFVEEADRVERETVQACGQLLGIELTSTSGPPEVTGRTRFTYAFFEPPTIMESILPDVRRFLPAGTARRLFEKEVRRRIPELVDKHCGRFRWDFRQRLDRSLHDLEAMLDERLESTIESLRAGLARSEQERDRSAASAADAEERARRWRERLDGIVAAVRPAAEGAAEVTA